MSNLNIQENISLANLTTFKIGGPARFLLTATQADDVALAMDWAQKKSLPVLVMGGGSNLLIGDQGWHGLVLRLAVGGWNFQRLEYGSWLVKVGSGVYITALAHATSNRGLSGLEWVGSLPGTLGGAIRGNAGAFRVEIGEIVSSVLIWHDGKTLRLSHEECVFGYRDSIFKNKYNDAIILEANLDLKSGDKIAIKKLFDEKVEHRVANLPKEPSAGCIFKNFFFQNQEDLKPELRAILPAEYLGYKKIPAAWLIEQAGLKGQKQGGAQISTLHANFIVNTGGAKAKDILDLIVLIKQKVSEKFNINLIEEVQII